MDHKKATAILSLTGTVITEQSVMKAWKRRLATCHPDKNQDVNACEATQLINQAKDCMLKALDDGVFANDALDELGTIMKAFKEEMREFEEQARINQEGCRERMKLLMGKKTNRYLEIEASQLTKKAPKLAARIFVKRTLQNSELGRKILENIRVFVDEVLEECKGACVAHVHLQELYRKKHPDASDTELKGMKYNLTAFIAKKFTCVRHFYVGVKRSYQNIKIVGQEPLCIRRKPSDGRPLRNFVTIKGAGERILLDQDTDVVDYCDDGVILKKDNRIKSCRTQIVKMWEAEVSAKIAAENNIKNEDVKRELKERFEEMKEKRISLEENLRNLLMRDEHTCAESISGSAGSENPSRCSRGSSGGRGRKRRADQSSRISEHTP